MTLAAHIGRRVRALIAMALCATTAVAQPLAVERGADLASFLAGPQGQALAEASQRLDRVFQPLCAETYDYTGSVLDGASLAPATAQQKRCAPVPLVTARRYVASIDEHNGHHTALFAAGLDAFDAPSELPALLAQHAAFAIRWERSNGRVFTSARRDYFSAHDTAQADAAALAALHAAGYEPGTYLPVLQKVRAMLLATPVVFVYHNTPQTGLLSTRGEISEERRLAIEKAVAALKSGGYAAHLTAGKITEAPRILGILAMSGADAAVPPDVRDSALLPGAAGGESRAAYERWLQRPLPRAFAMHPNGGWSASWGKADAGEQALRTCTDKRGAACALYAVDNTVVWHADPQRRVTLSRLSPQP